MNKILSFLLAFSFTFIGAVGFEGNTLVVTSSGRLKPIKDLSIGDSVISYNKNIEQINSTIKGISALNVNSSIHITTEENISITVSGMERFYLPQEGAWVYAKSLQEGDCFLNDDLQKIAIARIEQCDEPQKMYYISVEKTHNFLASEGRYLVHNGPLAGIQAYWATKIALYGSIGIVVGGAMAATGGTITAAAAAPTTGSAIAAGGFAAAGTVVMGAESATALTAAVTGASAITTVSASTIASIEAASMAAFSLACACPWLP